MYARVCAKGTDSFDSVMNPDSFESVFRIDTVKGVDACDFMWTLHKGICLFGPSGQQLNEPGK